MAPPPPPLLLLLAWCAAAATAHWVDDRAAAFMIHPTTDAGHVSVSARALNATAKCVFRFVTRPTPPPQGRLGDDATLSKAEILKAKMEAIGALGPACVHARVGYWDFEVCLGDSVSQRHGGEQFSLGTFSGFNMDGEQVYEKGTVCEGVPGNPARSATVEFVCNPASEEMLLVKATENQMQICSYKLVVTSPHVCASSKFRKVEGVLKDNLIGGEGTGEEDWMLQMSEFSNGRFACSVFATQLQNRAQMLYFHQFELKMEHWLAAAHPDCTARSFDRQRIAHNDLRVDRGSVSEGENFKGGLSYLKVYSQPALVNE